MPVFTRSVLIVAALVMPATALFAQRASDPSGHWQGTLQAPDSPVDFDVDLATSASGEWTGTLTVPSQHIAGLPLRTIAVTGTAVTFQARSDQSFTGVVSADANSMSGSLAVGSVTIPFTMVRIGAARIAAPPKSAPIATALEGTWNGALAVQGATLRLVLTMANQSDGTATGRIVNVDEGGLQVPVSIKQDGPMLTIDSRVIDGSFSGVLDAAGSALVGTYTQRGISAPLTFRRQP
jgi:hypothetical protein